MCSFDPWALLLYMQVTLGRMTMDSAVDIDLGKEGRANKVSRKQVLFITSIMFIIKSPSHVYDNKHFL